jgi:hypothetical protein
MKSRITLLPFAIYLLILGCTAKKVYSGEVNYLSATEPGTLFVSAAGYGETKANAIGNAEVNAFNTLIFKGVPGSQHHMPMLKDEAAARSEFKSYFDNLLYKNGYKAFMMLSEAKTDYQLTGRNQKNILVDVKINVAALRREMEQHGVLRKFGL